MKKQISCPACKTVMIESTFKGICVDRCPGCGGIWFDGGEHEDLRKMRYSPEKIEVSKANGSKTNRPTGCPSCGNSLLLTLDESQPHVSYEKCVICSGIFLETGEYTDLHESTIAEWLISWSQK